MDTYDTLMQVLNNVDAKIRLDTLRQIKKLLDEGLLTVDEKDVVTNNHIHTKYSFSPYSPAKAAWMGYRSGLATVGIMDHDTLSGAREFIESCEILGIPSTIGFEIRTDWHDTPLSGKRINNPDQISPAYVSAHGIPHHQIEAVDAFLQDIRMARNKRNRLQVENINTSTSPYGIAIDFDRDVVPFSYVDQGGTITERHLLFTLAHKIVEAMVKGEDLVSFLEHKMEIQLTEKQKQYLLDTDCDVYQYDLLNVFKSSFLKRIYVDTSVEETPPVKDVVTYIRSIGAIPSYCYLGDVDASSTGDKAAQKFEDDYLEDLFSACADLGFDAIAFMPTRNTREQLTRVMGLCEQYGFMQISGEDINQPRQSFICDQLRQPEYRHLIDTTWALIGHEKAASASIENGMFYHCRPGPSQLDKRIEQYKKMGNGEL